MSMETEIGFDLQECVYGKEVVMIAVYSKLDHV